MSTIISFLNLSLKSFSLAGLLSLVLPNSHLIDSAQIELQPERNQDPFIRARQTMIERDLVGRGIRDARVLEVMGSIPRERFVTEIPSRSCLCGSASSSRRGANHLAALHCCMDDRTVEPPRYGKSAGDWNGIGLSNRRARETRRNNLFH